ncbi:hypothetical protein [Streptomyces sp. NPDC002566]|uniref:hypothetical protein n=1 Tax=Streptomyces sp. NPDC002566 TaxID=3364650 RepID=UPI0036B3254D
MASADIALSRHFALMLMRARHQVRPSDTTLAEPTGKDTVKCQVSPGVTARGGRWRGHREMIDAIALQADARLNADACAAAGTSFERPG